MTSEQIFSLAASAAFLGLAALAAVRGAKNPLALPLALVCVDLFAYNSLEVLGSLSGSPRWEWLESVAAAFAAPLLVHFTLVFLGLRRERRALLIGTYAYLRSGGGLVPGAVRGAVPRRLPRRPALGARDADRRPPGLHLPRCAARASLPPDRERGRARAHAALHRHDRARRRRPGHRSPLDRGRLLLAAARGRRTPAQRHAPDRAHAAGAPAARDRRGPPW
ncbi:MAG: hypothetical protein M5U28_34200 [Sandaracinaceae bacterium]|nr:hypothetical protein [Sandaracinaceae bacterium]